MISDTSPALSAPQSPHLGRGTVVIVVIYPNPLWGAAAGDGLGYEGIPFPPQESGLSVWIGGQLHPLENVPPALAVLLITVVIAFFTEFASNTATIIIFLPVLAELVRVLLGKRGAPLPQHTFRNLPPAKGASLGSTVAIAVLQNT